VIATVIKMVMNRGVSFSTDRNVARNISAIAACIGETLSQTKKATLLKAFSKSINLT
jgi:hypothetical protein